MRLLENPTSLSSVSPEGLFIVRLIKRLVEMEAADKVRRNLQLLRKELFGEDPNRRRPIGPLPRTPCACGAAAAAFHGSLSHLKDLARKGDKEKVKEQLEQFVVPNQEDFNRICLTPLGVIPVVGARDILAFDLPKRDWQERVEKSASSIQLWITTRLAECLKKEIVRE